MENNLVAIEKQLADVKVKISFFSKLKKKPSANWDIQVVLEALEDLAHKKADLMKMKKQLA